MEIIVYFLSIKQFFISINIIFKTKKYLKLTNFFNGLMLETIISLRQLVLYQTEKIFLDTKWSKRTMLEQKSHLY
jgi:hypothetical protein